MRTRSQVFTVVSVALIVGLLATTFAASAQGARSVRGFDGSTVTIAGLGIASQFMPDSETGTNARINRFNATSELKGVKIKLAEMADSGFTDPGTALSEGRRLVTQDQVFAIVPMLSQTVPGDYLAQQHVPFFGWGFDKAYCSPAVSTKVWGFSWDGCVIPPDAKRTGDLGIGMYKYVSEKTGKKHPTIALYSTDTAGGKLAVQGSASTYAGEGWNVVYAKAEVPDPVTDMTPYVQRWITSDNGHAPDAIGCLGSTACITNYGQVKAAGFTGEYLGAPYFGALAKILEGAVVLSGSVPLETTGVPALEQMKQDFTAVKPGSSPSAISQVAYFSADFFIQALKKVAKQYGVKGITPERVQQVASTMTWEIKGLAGPVKYPASTYIQTPTCAAVVVSDGTKFNTVEPFACSYKTYPMLDKYKS